MQNKYEVVIGLEVHVQLSAKTKVFCGCSTAFGQSPNSATCPVCLGLPGSLPVLNKEAFRCAVKVALALNCGIQDMIKFDRKHYYYPDLPKNYQISQYDKPVGYEGAVRFLSDSSKSIKVCRVHLEEDAGKLLHDQDKYYSVVDYNRTGTPLLEIVTHPDIRSAQEAYEYLTSLKTLIKYLGVSDCNMEEGSLRCDANISLRDFGETKLGVKSELKNMNSFKAVRSGLEYEIKRHTEILDNGKSVIQETRLWDPDKQRTFTMRSKEEAHDYRYFPEPDLVPFHVSKEEIERIKRELPELPAERMERMKKSYQLEEKELFQIIEDKDMADYFEAAVRGSGNPKQVLNWLTGDIMKLLNEKRIGISGFGFTSSMLIELIELVNENVISGKMAKGLLIECANKNMPPKKIVEDKGLKQISNASELEDIILKVISENGKSVSDYKNGKENALMFLVGQVMKLTKGKANPGVVNELLRKGIDE